MQVRLDNAVRRFWRTALRWHANFPVRKALHLLLRIVLRIAAHRSHKRCTPGFDLPPITSLRMAKRLFPLTLGVLLVAYSAAALIFDTKTATNGAADSAACRFLPCGDRLPAQARQIAWQPLSEEGSSALPVFQEALRRDPASPYRWSDLAEANWQAGLEQDARYCFRQAVRQGPHIPSILLRAANFYFIAGQRQAALELGARCLAAFRDYDEVIFHQYLRMGGSLTDILRYGIPPERPAARSFFRFLLRPGSDLGRHPDPGDILQQTWEWLQTRSLAEPDLLGEYVSSLLGRGRYRHAISVQTASMEIEHGPDGSGNNLFNGGFDREFSSSPLGWRIYPAGHASAVREKRADADAAWSLRLDFDGQANLDYSHVRQQVVVRPGRHRFRARVRPNHLTTDQGIGFRIFDPNHWRRLDIFTAHVSGTSGWKRVEKRFTIPPGTELVEVWIVRRASSKFDNKIGGTVWIDDVSLVPAVQVR